ncbi:DUF1906 domain-containing protein [Streptomyces sp. NPDC051561]|uniref:DUF1906 domain-containing protein n=1 Tax=Streptomyces sp. NPDC051561 TaxID=3365658 RepID=UPI0037A8CAED
MRISAYVRQKAPGRAVGLVAALVASLATLVLPVDASAGDADPGQSSAGSGKPVYFNGWAFDTCEAPSPATMRAWRRSSSYRAVGIYFGGPARGCPRQKHLGRKWVQSVGRMGWYILAVYVGSQAPCVNAGHKRRFVIGRNPWQQGTAQARDAVERAGRLGLFRGSTLYLDMEAYDIGNKPCAQRTLAFVRAWNREVRRHGYFPGFYSSANSGVRHMELARRARTADLPTAMWFARWHTPPAPHREPVLAGNAWTPHRRIHQYAGQVRETHGGHRLNIDRNRVDALVARTRR